MKIAFVYDALYPAIKGGVEKRLYELGRRLAEKHEVHWYTFDWFGRGNFELDGMTIHSLGKPVDLYRGNVRDPFEALTFSFRILKKMRGSYDVVDCQEFPYLHAYPLRFKFPNIPGFVITWHEYWGEYWREYLPIGSYFGKLAENGLLNLTENHVVVSKHTLRRLLRVKRRKFELVPNGIDFDLIQSIPPHPELGYDAIFVGRLIQHKNVDFLLRTLRVLVDYVPDFTLGVIGDGPQRKYLEELAKKLGIERSVEFLGFMPSFGEVISIIKSSKVLAFPSTREGFGIVVLEANAAGVPVVTVDAPLNASQDLILEGKNGYVSSLDVTDFVEKLLLTWERSSRMRSSSLSLAREYDWDVISRKLEQYYEGVLNGS